MEPSSEDDDQYGKFENMFSNHINNLGDIQFGMPNVGHSINGINLQRGHEPECHLQ